MSVIEYDATLIESKRLERVQNIFGEGFGVDVEVWTRVDDDWRPAAETDCTLESTDLDGVWETRTPQLASAADGFVLLAPVGGGRFPTIAVIPCSNYVDPLAVRLAEAISERLQAERRVEELTNEVDCFARQVTADFEELTFLRRIPDVLDVAEQSFDLGNVARSVLNNLVQLIGARGIAFIASRQGKESSSSEVTWVGEQTIDQTTVDRLLEMFGANAKEMPYVRNDLQDCDECRHFSGLRELILVPVCKSDSLMGWLLAVNRIAPIEQISEWDTEAEFGTSEATLLASTASILATHASNVEHFLEKEELLTAMARVIVSAIEAKDKYTCGHSERVALYGRRLAEELGFGKEACERLYLTGLLHDVGKIGVNDAILTKPDKLTDEEFEEIKKHPEKGWAILRELEQLNYVLPGVLFHHERVDGRGYPDGLEAEEIPLDGRILAVADAYDAMTSDRPYRKGMPQKKAEHIIRDGAGEQWDEKVVNALFNVMDDIIRIRESYEGEPEVVRTHASVATLPTALDVNPPHA